MDTFHRTFCRRCFMYNCLTHIESVEHVFPEYQKKKGPPLVQRGPCSETCYLSCTSGPSPPSTGGNSEKMSKMSEPKENEWTVGDANMYGALASVYPGNYCAIGKIMEKPCKLVQLHALSDGHTSNEIIPEQEPDSTAETAKAKLPPASTLPVVQKVGRKKGDPLKRLRPMRPISPNSRYIPCFHPGSPCGDGNQECTCKEANTYCEKFCNCSDSCKNRFQGCWCHSTCSSGICPCFAAGRECDPDLCKNCGAGKVDGTTTCTNNVIQKGLRKHLHLAKSDIPNAGWGVFTKLPIEKNEFIYEYAGELISYAEAERRGLSYDKRCHTYLFELNDHFMIDAMAKGNKMRFANHSDNPNCIVRTTMVNGDHRIGIFAKRNIEAGEELFIFYKNVLTIHQEEQEKRDKKVRRKRVRK